MSDPLSDVCAYCGSPDVLDDAWWCESQECWQAYEAEERKRSEYELRTPLTVSKAMLDLRLTKAQVWGPISRDIERAAGKIARLANLPVR